MRYFVTITVSYMETKFEFNSIDAASTFAERAVKSHVEDENAFKVYVTIEKAEETENDGDD